MFLFDEAGFVQLQDLPIRDLWLFLPIGYLITVLIEAPILVAGLSRKFTFKERLAAGFWLTLCTYPIVVLVLPSVFWGGSRSLYLLVAEIFAPAAECVLFWLAFRGREGISSGDWFRCMIVIVVANLASFGIGELIGHFDWFGLF